MAQGDHLYVDRRLGSFTHHGIDCGDGTVIHYKDGASIIRSTRAFFSGGSQIRVRDYGQADPPSVVMKRALSRLGERDYNLIFNNCEHFATWCKTGQHQSQQVNQALGTAVAGGLLGGVLINPLLTIPALAAAGTYGIQQSLAQAQATTDPQEAIVQLRQAIAQVDRVGHDLEAQLQPILKEAYHWHCTAQLALQRGRDDLAKEALHKKYPLKQQALKLRSQLDEVETLALQLRKQLAQLEPNS